MGNSYPGTGVNWLLCKCVPKVELFSSFFFLLISALSMSDFVILVLNSELLPCFNHLFTWKK